MQEKDIYINNHLDLYTDAFFKNRTKRKTIRWEKAVGSCIVKCLNINSMVDFGCGLGHFLEGAKEAGATNILGYEYSYENAKKYLPSVIAPYIKYGNVMEDIDCGQFDCSMSIEVAEHILPEKSCILVKNLTKSATKYIILTAALPGQGGTGHINEQPHSFWIKQIEQFNFIKRDDERNSLFESIKSHNIKMPKHMYNNLMIFRRS